MTISIDFLKKTLQIKKYLQPNTTGELSSFFFADVINFKMLAIVLILNCFYCYGS